MKGLSPTTQKKSKLRFFFLTEKKFVQLRQKAETCDEIMNDQGRREGGYWGGGCGTPPRLEDFAYSENWTLDWTSIRK